MIDVTGSRAHRVVRCPASAVLDQEHDAEAEARSEPMRTAGQQIHGFLEAAALIGFDREAEMAKLDEQARRVADAIDLSVMPVGMSSEVALAWDWRAHRARELGRNLGHRDYASLPNPPTAYEIPFTADVLGVAGGLGYGADYKFGRSRYPRPAEFGQTLLSGLALRDLYGCTEIQLQLIRINEDGETFSSRDDADDWILDMFAEDLEEAMRWVHAHALNPSQYPVVAGAMAKAGDHCDYCPAFRACPEQAAFVRALPDALQSMGVRAEGALMVIDPAAITAAKAGALYAAAERIEEMMGRVKSEVCKLGWHFPVELPDGRVIEPHSVTRRSVDPAIALAVLEERYGREAAQGAISMETSFEAIKRVVVAHKAPGRPISSKKGTGAFDEVEHDLERRGGVFMKVTETCKPHRRPRLPVAK